MSSNQSKPVKKFSPGPWSAVKKRPTGFFIVDAQGCLVGVVKFHDAESKANAAMLAAAPDLLAALEMIASELSGPEKPYSSDSYLPLHMVTMIQDAIAKARGEG